MSGKSPKKLSSKTKTLGAVAAAAVGGWMLYSHLRPEALVPLTKAIDSEQRDFYVAQAGQLSYYVDSQHQGRPLLLLHSINAAPSSFEVKPLFVHYRDSRPVYALDLPGFGFSERSAERAYLPDVYIEAIIEMLDKQIGEPADVVALSLTGEFAARAALRRPKLFNSLTLISPSGLGIDPINLPGDAIYNFFAFPVWSQPIFDLLTVKPSVRFFLKKNFVGEVPEQFVDYAYATSHQPGARFAPLYFLSGQLFMPDVRTAVYQKLAVPTLIIYDRDPNLSFAMLPKLLSLNSTCRAERVAPSLGLPHWEMPLETTTALENFWAESR